MPEYTKQELLEEAYNRGLLTDEKKAIYEEAMNRGLLNENIDKSPIELDRQERMVGGKDPFPVTIEAPGADLARQGIDVTTGAPVGRGKASFAQNEALAVEYLSEKLSQYYEEPVRVKKGEHGLEFINPKTNRRTLVDEKMLTGRDVAEGVAPSLPILGAVSGSIFGSMVGAPNIGAGIGAGIGEAIKRGLGHVFGVREATAGEELLGVGGVGVIEGGASKFGEALARTGNRIRSFWRPNVLSAEDAGKLITSPSAIQNEKIAKEIELKTGRRFQPFTGQITDDPALLGHQSTLRTDPETAIRFRNQQIQNESTLEKFYDDLNPVPDAPDTSIGRSVQLEARDQTKPRIEAVRDSVDQAVEDLKTITNQLPAAENSAIVNEATAAAAAAREVIKTEERRVWGIWNDAIGLDEGTALSSIKVPVKGPVERQMKIFAAEAKNAIDPDDAAGKFRLMPNAFKPKKEQVLNPVTGRVSTQTTPAEVDLNQLQLYIGSLKRRLRTKYGNTALDPTGRDIQRQLDAAITQRDEFLRKNHPDLLPVLSEAEGMTRTRAELFDKGLVSQLLRREGGEWTITDAQLVGGVIGTGDRGAMEHLVTAFGYHPAGVPTLQKSFLQYYRNKVVRDGVPVGALHDDFIRTHKEAINVLFPNDRRIMQLGEFEKVVTKKVERFAQFEKAMKKTFRGSIQRIDPEHVVSKVFTDKFSIKDVGRLTALADAAGAGHLYRNAIRNQIRNRFRSITSGVNIKSLDDFLVKNEHKLVTALGGRWYKDMRLLTEGFALARKTQAGISTTRRPKLMATIAEGVARATVARPLSPHGVALTKSINFNQRAKNRVWAEIVENPDALRAIVANRNTDLQTEAAARILAIIGGEYMYQEVAENFNYEALQEVFE